MMEEIRAKLADRLTAKGLESNETELFIQDVIRIVTSSSGFDIDTIKASRSNSIYWDGVTIIQTMGQSNSSRPAIRTV